MADRSEMTDHDRVSAGTAWADFDRDGDLDIFIANWGEADARYHAVEGESLKRAGP